MAPLGICFKSHAVVLYSLFYLLVVCMGGFVGMEVLGCGKLVLDVRAAKTTIGRV